MLEKIEIYNIFNQVGTFNNCSIKISSRTIRKHVKQRKYENFNNKSKCLYKIMQAIKKIKTPNFHNSLQFNLIKKQTS